jgi:hypothetical protein
MNVSFSIDFGTFSIFYFNAELAIFGFRLSVTVFLKKQEIFKILKNGTLFKKETTAEKEKPQKVH